MSPRVSVIIPTYSHREHVGRTLESVFAQTWRDFEVIVVDDGSRDGTEALLRPLAERGEIRYLRQENRGAAAARNAGLALARGEYAAFLDDDDLWPADKLEWQVAALGSSAALAVGGTMRVFGPDEEPEVPAATAGEAVRAVLLDDLYRDGNAFQTPGQALIRRDALLRAGGFDETLWGADDYDLWMRLIRLGEVRSIDRLALLYRVHGGNASADLARMAANITAAQRKNVAGRPDATRLLRAGRRHVFRWQGKRLVWEGARRLRQGQGAEGRRLLGLGVRLGFAADPVLLLALLLALLKAPYKAFSDG